MNFDAVFSVLPGSRWCEDPSVSVCEAMSVHVCLSFTAQNGVNQMSVNQKCIFSCRVSFSFLISIPFLSWPVVTHFINGIHYLCRGQIYPAIRLSSTQPVDFHCSSVAHLLLLFIFVNLSVSLSFIFDSALHSLSLCLGEM